jgi:hypothetical protein
MKLMEVIGVVFIATNYFLAVQVVHISYSHLY